MILSYIYKILNERHGIKSRTEATEYRKSCWNELESIFNSIDNFPDITVLDIGASGGIHDTHPYRPFHDHDQLKYIGFEPHTESYNRLTDKYTNKEYRFFDQALYREEATKTLYITKNPVRSSIYEPNEGVLKTIGEEFRRRHTPKSVTDITTVDLDTISSRVNLPQADAAYIDTQGAEFDILSGGRESLTNCKIIELEMQVADIYDQAGNFHEVLALTDQMGFELLDLYYKRRGNDRIYHPIPAGEMTETGNGRITQVFGLFVKNEINFDHFDLLRQLSILIAYGKVSHASYLVEEHGTVLSQEAMEVVRSALKSLQHPEDYIHTKF